MNAPTPSLPAQYLGRPVPAAYLDFVAQLQEPVDDFWQQAKVNGQARKVEVQVYTAAMLQARVGQGPYAPIPRYAYLAHAEYFKPLETREGEPTITQQEVASGLVIGWANEGKLFINLHDGSVWIAYSDWFCEWLAPSFERFAQGLP